LSNGGVLLINGRGLLIDEGILVYILSFKGITVYNLRFKRAPARKINLKATLTYSLSLIEWINYKARDFIEFKRDKRFNNFDLFLDFLFNLFCQVFFI
jgi:hypothetical protein